MANDTKLTWAKAHAHWLGSTDFLFASVNARLLWFCLNILARESSAGGALLVGDRPMSVKDVAYRINLNPDEVESGLQELENINWVTRENGVIFIIDYFMEQALNGDDLSTAKSRDYGRMRSRKFEGKETNRDLVVKSNAASVIRALDGMGYLTPNTISQVLYVTNHKTANKAVVDLKNFLAENGKNDQDFLSVCYDSGYIPLDDGAAYDQIWETLQGTDKEIISEAPETPPETPTEALEMPLERQPETIKRFRGWDEDSEIQNLFVTLHTRNFREFLLKNPDYVNKIFRSDINEILRFLEDPNADEWLYGVLETNGWSLKSDDEALKAMIEVGDATLKNRGPELAKPFRVDDFEKLNQKYFGDGDNVISESVKNISPDPEELEEGEYPF